MRDDKQIIFPAQIAVPEEAFKFLEYLRESVQSQLGLADIESLKMMKRASHTDTSEKISEQIK